MFRPILVPHGITDIVDYPIKSIVAYGVLTPLVAKLPWETKAGVLLVASVYHMRNDVPFGLKGNIALHVLWLYQPWFAEAYLTWIHVPRHYGRNFWFKPEEKIVCIACMTVITVIDMVTKWSARLPDLWWVGPVVAHVLLERLHQGVKDKAKCDRPRTEGDVWVEPYEE